MDTFSGPKGVNNRGLLLYSVTYNRGIPGGDVHHVGVEHQIPGSRGQWGVKVNGLADIQLEGRQDVGQSMVGGVGLDAGVTMIWMIKHCIWVIAILTGFYICLDWQQSCWKYFEKVTQVLFRYFGTCCKVKVKEIVSLEIKYHSNNNINFTKSLNTRCCLLFFFPKCIFIGVICFWKH